MGAGVGVGACGRESCGVCGGSGHGFVYVFGFPVFLVSGVVGNGDGDGVVWCGVVWCSARS